MPGEVMDIFRGNAFGVVSMTDATNKIPFVPGRLGAMGLFRERGYTTKDIAIEEREGKLYLVQSKPRNGVPQQNVKDERKVRVLRAVHLPVQDTLEADEIQGVRAFGTENQLQTIQGAINDKLTPMVQSEEATIEFHRVGAVKGVVRDADGSTIYDLFTEFGITAYADVNFAFSAAAADTGAQRARCADITRKIANALGGTPFMGVHAICGDDFFDGLLREPEVRASYRGTSMAEVLRQGYVYPNNLKIYGAFEFGGIVWENYRGGVGNTQFVSTGECHFFPVGAPGLFETAFAPAPYMETVNTVGRPLYTKITPAPKNTHVDIDVQSNPLVYCTRPKVLIKGKNA